MSRRQATQHDWRYTLDSQALMGCAMQPDTGSADSSSLAAFRDFLKKLAEAISMAFSKLFSIQPQLTAQESEAGKQGLATLAKEMNTYARDTESPAQQYMATVMARCIDSIVAHDYKDLKGSEIARISREAMADMKHHIASLETSEAGLATMDLHLKSPEHANAELLAFQEKFAELAEKAGFPPVFQPALQQLSGQVCQASIARLQASPLTPAERADPLALANVDYETQPGHAPAYQRGKDHDFSSTDGPAPR